MMLKGIICGLVCFLVFLLNIPIFRCFNIKRRFSAIAIIFFSGLIVYCYMFFSLPEKTFENSALEILTSFFNGCFLHFFFFYFYLHLLQIIDRTPTTRIMLEIETSPEKKLTYSQIKNAYDIGNKVDNTLEDMVMLGRLEKDGSYYRLTKTGKRHIALFRLVRDFIKLRRS